MAFYFGNNMYCVCICYFSRGYETFKNNPIKLADNIKPVKAEITEAIKQFKSIASKKLDPETGKPLVLSDDVARDMVDEVKGGVPGLVSMLMNMQDTST